MPDAHPRTRRTAVLATVVGLLAAPLTFLSPAAPASAAPQTITLLNINDFHGRIQESTATNGRWSGTTAFAAVIEQQRAAAPASTALLSAGDNIGASLYASSSQQDTPTLDVLNALDMKASAVGNHEFDRGSSDLFGRVDEQADFPYLGANVYRDGTTTPAMQEYEIVRVGDVNVGVVGAVTQETPTLVSPDGVSTLDFGEPVAAVNRVAAQLRDGDAANGEADVVVAEYHEGAPLGGTATLAQQKAASAVFTRIVDVTSDDVAAIFTGHTHAAYAYDDGGRPIVQTGSYGANIGKITMTVDPETDAVSAATGSNVPATTTVDPATLYGTYPRVKEVADITTAAIAAAKEIGSVVVGAASADITRARTGPAEEPAEDRGSESTLGGLVGNALRDTLAPEQYGSAEIGVVNPGGLRADLAAGDITAEDANSVLPFANNLNTITLTGAQFKTLLEQQWQTNEDGSIPSRAYLQLGLSDNVSYTYDPDAAQGSRITSISVDGAPIDPARGYRIGTFSFLQAGGDNFRVFREGTDPQDSGLVDFDGWVQYLKDNNPVAPSFARRSVVVTDQPSEVTAGDDVTFGVSRLDLTSAGSPANTSLEVGYQAEGSDEVTALGTTPVSGGAATVTATIPEDAEGAGQLVLTAQPSGTVVRIPLTVEAGGPEVGPPSAKVKARSVADDRTETVRIVARARNTDTVPLDVRFTLPTGETYKVSKVQPGETVRHVFRTGKGSVPAGVVKVATYKYVDGQGYYQVYDAPYEALTATQDPRGLANASAFKVDGRVYYAGYFVNRGAHPVTVRMKTAYGNSEARTVRPGKATYFVVPTGKRSTRATNGVIAAYKYVDGRGWYREFGVRFPAR